MVGLRTLTPSVEVRILYPQPLQYLKHRKSEAFRLFISQSKFATLLLLQIIAVLISTSCTEAPTTLETKNGLKFEINQIKPFTGKYVTYYQNGPKKTETHFLDGNQSGLKITWYENGVKETEEYYLFGEKNGVRVEWYKSGRKKSEQSYKYDKRDGSNLVWDESGAIIKNETYKNGHLVKKTGLTYGLYQ